jgi:hypothetical protein
LKVRRVIEYEGSEADVRRQLERALLSAQAEIKPGDRVPGVGFINAGLLAPQVTIRLISEESIP